ncbi:hypothetical protein TWF730_009317 [Orbilia blumenaviensis]|uniref:F-box domain-containing protein n=1 Tax=Orbilia blumenaviensis TaxID=1796055 RepID=A0AAV9UXY4_9PEZI
MAKAAALQTLPLELHETISTYLIPQDIAALSLSCKSLLYSLGPNNQLLWYRLAARGLPAAEQPEPFTDTGERDYWREACDMFRGLRWGCMLCLKIEEPAGQGFEEAEDAVEKTLRVVKLYCQNCYCDWFVDLEKFGTRYPEIKIPIELTLKTPYSKDRFIVPIPTAIKQIEAQGKIPYDQARTASNRFIENWVYKGRPRSEAINLARAITFAIEEVYIKRYKHIQIALAPEELYDCFARVLVRKIISPKEFLDDGDDDDDYDDDDEKNKSAYFLPDVGSEIVKISEILTISESDGGDIDGNTTAAYGVEKARKLALDGIFSRIFCPPDDFRPENLADPDRRLLALKMGDAAEGALWWLCNFPFLYRGAEDPNYYTDKYMEWRDGGEFCYWCLRENGWVKNQKNGFYRFNPGRASQGNQIHKDWIMTHAMTAHKDLLWVMPKELGRPIRKEFSKQDRNTELESLQNCHELEEIPKWKVVHLDRLLSKSSYFVM